MAVENTIDMKFGYNGTDFKRTYSIGGVSSAYLSTAESKARAINTSLAGGTAGGLSSFFISDDYYSDGSETIGQMKAIETLKIKSVDTVYVFGGDSSV